MPQEDSSAASPKTQPDQRDPNTIVAKLTITLCAGGNIRLEGPIDDKMFCYGLLEAAKDAIRDFADQIRRKAAAQQRAGGSCRRARWSSIRTRLSGRWDSLGAPGLRSFAPSR